MRRIGTREPSQVDHRCSIPDAWYSLNLSGFLKPKECCVASPVLTRARIGLGCFRPTKVFRFQAGRLGKVQACAGGARERLEPSRPESIASFWVSQEKHKKAREGDQCAGSPACVSGSSRRFAWQKLHWSDSARKRSVAISAACQEVLSGCAPIWVWWLDAIVLTKKASIRVQPKMGLNLNTRFDITYKPLWQTRLLVKGVGRHVTPCPNT